MRMNKWLEILIGLVLIVAAVLVGWYSHYTPWDVATNSFGTISFDFGKPAWDFLKGGIIWFAIMIGLLLLLLGISDLRE
ncbi:MAG: hypothetical protein RL557_569 [archaeon]|jgi:membrane protein YdbS with pleckstrin-like domain